MDLQFTLETYFFVVRTSLSSFLFLFFYHSAFLISSPSQMGACLFSQVRRDREPADSLHRLREARAPSSTKTTSKVTPKQVFSSKVNEGLLLLQLGSEAHLKECRVLADELVQDYPRSAKPTLLLLSLNLRDHRYVSGGSGEGKRTSSAAAELEPKWRQVVNRAEALSKELSQSATASASASCDYDDVSMAPAEAQLFAMQVM
jgi:hypothetical protein